jgi:two-component system copper resistance phosphate regulon response regulator CusR
MQPINIGTVSLMPDRDEILVDAHPVVLTSVERAILGILAERRGSVVTRTELMLAAWDTALPPRTRELDEAVNALRAKLKDGRVTITSVPGIGYRLD